MFFPDISRRFGAADDAAVLLSGIAGARAGSVARPGAGLSVKAGKDREDSAQPTGFQRPGDSGTRCEKTEVSAGVPGVAGGGDEQPEAQGIAGGYSGQVEDQPASGAVGYAQKALAQSWNPEEVQPSADHEYVVPWAAGERGVAARRGHSPVSPSGNSRGDGDGCAFYGHHVPPRSGSHLDAAEDWGLTAQPSPAPTSRTGFAGAALEGCRAARRLWRPESRRNNPSSRHRFSYEAGTGEP